MDGERVELGDVVIDKVTRFWGIITIKQQHLYGPTMMFVEPPYKISSEEVGRWFVETRLSKREWSWNLWEATKALVR